MRRFFLIRHLVCAAACTTGGSVLAAAGPEQRPLRVIATTEVRLTDPLDPEVPTLGEARFLVLVDDKGKLQDLLLVGSTHHAFTTAAVTALQEWKFDPALEHGEPVWTRTTVRLNFNSRGRVIAVRGADVLPGLAGGPFALEFEDRLAREAELDAPLRAVHAVSPGFPVQLRGQITGRVTVSVDFYVDETGRPRMPVVADAEHAMLSAAAIETITQWRFGPPTRAGVPVIVRAKQAFVFFDSRGETAVPALP